MYTLALIFIFLLGTIIGSFLNVVIYRLGTGKSIVHGRSICMTCNKTLQWYELIPVFSFLIQSGRCRRCASSISHQYPIVEFIAGLVFVLITIHFLPVLSFSQNVFIVLVTFFSFIFSLLIVVSAYDIRHKIIPDTLIYLFIFLAFLSLFINYSGVGSLIVLPSLARILAGPLFTLPFVLLCLISQGKLMGLGDVKFILGIAWLFPPTSTFAALTLSFWIGTIVSLALILFSKKKIGMKTPIPFGPFLAVSAFIVFFFGLNIFSFASLFHF